MQNPLPRQLGIRAGVGRAVFTNEGNSGSRSGPLSLCPQIVQAEVGSAGASPFAVAAWGQFRLRGVGHVALSRRTPYRVAGLNCGAQPANKRMDLSSRGDSGMPR